MKYLRQFMIILLFSFLGELLKYVLPFPVPASIYGLVLLFIALETRILPLAAVKDAGKFMIEIMPLMFIPAGAGLIDAWDALRPICVQIVMIMVVSTIVVMIVSALQDTSGYPSILQAVLQAAVKTADLHTLSH